MAQNKVIVEKGQKVFFEASTMGDNAVRLIGYENGEELVKFTDEKFASTSYSGKLLTAKEDITADKFKDYGQLSDLFDLFEISPNEDDGSKGEEELGDIGTDPASLPKLEDEHTVGEYLKMLFGTTSPTILHVFKVLTKYGKDSSIYKLTGSLPTIQDVVFTKPAYTFSIVRMKNGCYYKIFVARTDMGRDNYGCWEETHNEPGRWLHLANVSDNRVNEAYRGRQI